MNAICDMAIEHFGIPVKNVMKNVSRNDFVCDGSILRMEFDTSHPLAYGMTKEAGTIFDNSCAFQILPSFDADKEPKSAAKYPKENPLMSGWIYGDRFIRQKTSIADVPHGSGRIILLGFPVQYRAQPFGNFRLLFNAVYYAGLN